MIVGRDLAARTRQNVAQRGNQQDTGTTGQPEQQDDSVTTMAHFINGLRSQIARALPRHMDADRMARFALTVLRRNTKLATCTSESFAGALLTAAALGLEPGVNDECYLVPYKNWDKEERRAWMECQLIIGYQGMAKQFYQHPLALDITAHAVRESDEFDWQYGTNAYLHHRPARGIDRGPVVDYYALARLTSGAAPFVVLSPDEVKTLRRGKEGPSGDIPDPQRWMERKTCVRQLAKLLPRSTTLSAAIAADERDGSELYRERLAERNAAEVIDLAPASVSDEPAGTAPQDDAPGGAPALEETAASAAEIRTLVAALKGQQYTTAADQLEWARNNIGPDLARLEDLTGAQARELAAILTSTGKE
ncbi:recombinase RecT [Nocardia amamiensis]|uniref:Recombinase RecT n=1 Tax=Nocardia amamiensis TaxID=404578 RepID=A0ABS0CNU5_9NOCA|nr:recombinase RecT [Nocardia amamiensis]MBF6298269.1 recombinase RecT [Nocardia amamiensis]